MNNNSKDLTFTPTINPRSVELAQKKADFWLPAYERLFQKAIKHNLFHNISKIERKRRKS